MNNFNPSWDLFPNNEYPEGRSEYKQANAGNENLFWVARGDKHAGIISTPAFQMITNGYRAKANRVYEAFTCNKFSVPIGSIPDSEDSNPDLTQREYCSHCHKALEPMADFFKKWPDMGQGSYAYNKDENIICLLYTSPSPRDQRGSRMPSSA